ncbi:ABC transporter substrate-binding protein [Haliovirga abyssi]|uniref:Iron ABC transporter substrate-binding protein n=1 Tax=Haliovirga abyssi TaxID=2996794 RepID=A0AAU9E118_9FUSO|nr:ABC transporter substrate-binding protein [Haliovirga abyssi]BDU51635.1 iron ABC transporter substrate-binding protein [Haliovirga abyssi]
MKKNLVMGMILMFVAGIVAQGGVFDFLFKNKKQETLTVYAGMMEDYALKATKQFEKETGIKTNMVRMSGGEILARIRAEKENPIADVWFGGGALTFIEADQENLLTHYLSPMRKEIISNFKDKNGAWTGIYSGYLGIEGNKKWLAEKGLELPQTWDDLLKPEFKNNIVIAHPGSSSTAYNFVATIIQLKGEEKGMEYLKKFNQQVRQYTKSGSAPGRMVGLGEAPIAIGFLHDGIRYQKEGYKDLIFTTPKEGTGYEIGAVGIVKNSPNQAAAKKFVDWALSKQAQEIGQTVGSYQFLTNKNATPPKEALQLKRAKLIDYDIQWAGANRKRLIDKFSRETRTTIPTK